MPYLAPVQSPAAAAARDGLSQSRKSLPPWLFYDERGSELFERITELPEYYLTRTERALFAAHSNEILLSMGGPVSVAELGAGSATKTGVLLAAAARLEDRVLYQPVDVSPSALDMAAENLQRELPGVRVQTQLANYVTEPYLLERPAGTRVLALYIGSSIGNFTPGEANGVLRNLRTRLERGDGLLLGTDLAPGPHKPVSRLLAAYDDRAGVTAAFNRNILHHLNHVVHANFQPELFAHEVRWNAEESRIEMHLRAEQAHEALIPADGAAPDLQVHFAEGETIHTENSYKFSAESLRDLLAGAGYSLYKTWTDPEELFAVTLAFAE